MILDIDTADEAWWTWCGGAAGAVVALSFTVGIPALGAVAFTVVFISIQLVAALIAHGVGAFDYPLIPIQADRRLLEPFWP